MDVRNVATVEPEVEHNGTVPVWWLIKPREMFDLTDGGYLELANEFEVAVGGEVFPHTHPTHEFYFVMTGEGVMTISGEERDVIRLHVVQPICLCLPLDPGFHSQLFGVIRLEGLKRRTGERLNG